MPAQGHCARTAAGRIVRVDRGDGCSARLRQTRGLRAVWLPTRLARSRGYGRRVARQASVHRLHGDGPSTARRHGHVRCSKRIRVATSVLADVRTRADSPAAGAHLAGHRSRFHHHRIQIRSPTECGNLYRRGDAVWSARHRRPPRRSAEVVSGSAGGNETRFPWNDQRRMSRAWRKLRGRRTERRTDGGTERASTQRRRETEALIVIRFTGEADVATTYCSRWRPGRRPGLAIDRCPADTSRSPVPMRLASVGHRSIARRARAAPSARSPSLAYRLRCSVSLS